MKRRKWDRSSFEILRILAVFAGAALLLKANASHFDSTELTTLMEGLLAYIGGRSVLGIAASRKRKDSNDAE